MRYDIHPDDAVRLVIDYDENLLWTGKPIPLRVALQDWSRLLRGGWSILFGVFWLSFTTGFFRFGGSDFGSGSSPFSGFGFFSLFPLIGLVIIGIGLYHVAQPVLLFLQAGRMVYAITDRRALIIQPTASGSNIASYYPDQLETLRRNDIADGRGDLIFASDSYTVSGRYGRREVRRNVGFFGVENVREVEATFRNALLSPRKTDPALSGGETED